MRHSPVLLLEFGVYEGASIRTWSEILLHPQTPLHGLDSFEGLPEHFDERSELQTGAFSTQGTLPRVTDSRIGFHKGWFGETLPHFSIPDHEFLIISCDADLYSSTIFVLKSLDTHIVPGTLLCFDDLANVQHEPQAFGEYIDWSGKRFQAIAAAVGYQRAVFQCVAASDTKPF